MDNKLEFFFPLGLCDFAVSYGLSVAILNMIWFLLFTAKLLIITIQGERLWDITMKAVGFRSKHSTDTTSTIYYAP